MIQPLFLALAVPILAVVALCLLWPLRSWRGEADRRDHDLAVYRDQLTEVDRDQAQGLIPADQAEAARIEIRRRILRAGERSVPTKRVGKTVPVGAVVGIAAGLPLLAFFTYLALGRPDLPSLPFAERPREVANSNLPALRDQAAALRARLAQAPDDVDGWVRLGRLQVQLGQIDTAVRSVRRAAKAAPADGRVQVELADLLTRAASGTVTPEAKDLFERSVAAAGGQDQADPRAVYFLGVADAQAGDLGGAIQRWRRLLARAPADAPWRAQLIESIQVASTEAGGPTQVSPAGPSQADVQAMAALSPTERSARIQSMVDGLQARLEEVPDDVDGWLRLGRARAVLGQDDQAAAAFARAARLHPDDPAILEAWGNALVAKKHAPTGMPLVDAEAEAVFARLEKLAPNRPQPAWFLGLAAVQRGDREAAAKHWQALLARLPEDDPDRASVEQLIAALGV